MSINKDVQFKFSRTDNTINKIENEHATMMTTLKDLQNQFQEFNRNVIGRMHDVENRVCICY